MSAEESGIHSFIVRIWLEENAADNGKAVWRGSVTHVLSGRQRYIQGLDEIGAFILPYLQEMGVKLGTRWRLKRWLNQRKLF